MNITINDKSCEAFQGQTLSKAARINHSHVGYLCGGHGVCQTCQVIVQEGAEHLSPVNDVEKAFLTQEQIASGYRMACRATIVGEGPIRLLSRPELVRRLLFTNPLPLFSYGAEIGRGVASQFIPGVGNLVSRIVKGEIINENELEDFKDGVDGLVGLTIETLPEYLPFKDQVMEVVSKLPIQLPQVGALQLPSIQLPIQLPIDLPFIEKKPGKKDKGAVQIKFTPRKNAEPDQFSNPAQNNETPGS